MIAIRRAMPNNIITKIVRNRKTLEAFLVLGTTRDQTRRRAALEHIEEWTTRRTFELSIAPASNSFKGFARDLFHHEPIKTALTSVPHLGCLAPIAKTKATRADYVTLIAEALLSIKERNPGLGLGSTALREGTTELSGLELTQTWALLFNLGHLFGTFATERGVLFYVDSDQSLRSELLGLVPRGFKSKARTLVNERSMYRFFYILAAIRVATIGHPQAAILHRAIELFPVDDISGEMGRYLWAFKKARQIAYCRMHSLLKQGLSVEASAYAELTQHLRTYQEFGFDPEADSGSTAGNLLNGIDGFHAETVFTNKIAAELVLGHLREFKTWWTSVEVQGMSLPNRLAALWTTPSNWPAGRTSLPPHYVRLLLPEPRSGWIAEVRDWRASAATWGGADVLISPAPSSQRLTCDIYGDRPLSLPATYHVASLLAFRNAATWNASDVLATRSLWRAVARFGIQQLQDCLRSDVFPTLTPTPVKDEGIGYAILSNGLPTARSRLDEFLKRVRENNRRAELSAVLDHLNDQQIEGEQPYILTLLGRVELFRGDERRPLAEIDGVLAFIRQSSVEWYLFEHKGGSRRSGGGEQLNRLGQLFTLKLSEPIWTKRPTGQVGMVNGRR
jgi:hypothetical protein